MSNKKKISVIGLGSMGYGIAQSLVRSGYIVYGQDINPAQQQKLIEEGGAKESISFDLLDAVFIVVLNDKQTRDILFGEDGIAKKLRKGALIIVCTTVSPAFAKEMAINSNSYIVTKLPSCLHPQHVQPPIAARTNNTDFSLSGVCFYNKYVRLYSF